MVGSHHSAKYYYCIHTAHHTSGELYLYRACLLATEQHVLKDSAELAWGVKT